MYKYYVGKNSKTSPYCVKVFKDNETPTPDKYPQFQSVIGPFRTKRAATFSASFAGTLNPHCQCVEDAERISKSLKEKR